MTHKALPDSFFLRRGRRKVGEKTGEQEGSGIGENVENKEKISLIEINRIPK